MSKEGKLPHRVLHSVNHKLSNKVIVPISYATLAAGIVEVPLTDSSVRNVLSAVGLLAVAVAGFASVFAKEGERYVAQQSEESALESGKPSPSVTLYKKAQ